MMQVNVTGGTISDQERDAYIARANSKYAIGTVQALDIHVDGDYVDLRYHLTPRPFSRIRRITGYLVGDMSNWHNAKAAEERARVKHIRKWGILEKPGNFRKKQMTFQNSADILNKPL